MAVRNAEADRPEPQILNLFVSEEGDAHRAYLGPVNLPRYLLPFFDLHGEAFPVLFDLEDLDRHMAAASAAYEKRVTAAGSVEITARGASVKALCLWLSTALASGVRQSG